MSHHEHRLSLVAEKTQGVENLADEFRIERRRDFIEKHVVRFHGQCAGNRKALLLASGHLVRVDIELVPQADMFKLLAGHVFGILLGLARDNSGRQRDVFKSRQMGEGIPLLEHHAYFLAQLVDVCSLGVNIRPVDKNLAALDRFQRVDAIQQG